MKPGSLPLAWKSGVVLPMVGLLLACAAGRGTLPEARTQAAIVSDDGKTYTMEKVDEPVQVIAEPEPRFPKALLDSLISGRVELRYVVDTTGHAEPNSFWVVNKTHEEFVEPAKEAILAGVFRPARFRGRFVRQLVQQRIVFNAHP